jgi:hypothetical protein
MEFISAKDLPITEAEEVDVLCVENGEMKRKPASGIGGNSEYVAVIKETEFWNPELNDGNGDWDESIEFVGEHPTFEEFVTMAKEGICPKFLCIGEYTDESNPDYRGENIGSWEESYLGYQAWCDANSGEILEEVVFLANNYRMLPDGTLEWS